MVRKRIEEIMVATTHKSIIHGYDTQCSKQMIETWMVHSELHNVCMYV